MERFGDRVKMLSLKKKKKDDRCYVTVQLQSEMREQLLSPVYIIKEN